eukprot:CAMPEP_0172183226 /NCGR_PEP_ID=MMETSP1050-20130122/18862_1 /TAXON_ID=233186 /ORGANISM="Cryptomonas curvata, Strain CCAP979/52" /LENGTH=147 /DNA_ID=CAMNT_0012856809 /DNA_START=1394 /DNA_END=1835 /DNA_ORIENTATION=+
MRVGAWQHFHTTSGRRRSYSPNSDNYHTWTKYQGRRRRGEHLKHREEGEGESQEVVRVGGAEEGAADDGEDGADDEEEREGVGHRLDGAGEGAEDLAEGRQPPEEPQHPERADQAQEGEARHAVEAEGQQLTATTTRSKTLQASEAK